MVVRILVALIVLSARAHAQPSAALGKPLPAADLPIGTVSVRVVAGAASQPAVGVTVTLAIAGGRTMTKATDASARAVFDGIAAESRVTVSVPSKAPDVARGTFAIPDSGGLRVMLSTEPWRMPGLPGARELSGKARPDPDVAAGTASVRLAYDDLRDPKPPAGIVVTLVGYAADNKVTIARKPSDATGLAAFSGLDPGGRTAYFAFAMLPRHGTFDRIGSEVFVLDGSAGMRVILSSHKRDSKEPPLDDLPAVAKGKVHVATDGIPDPSAAVEVIDAASGKLLAKGTPKPGASIELDVKTAPGQVLYAQTTARNETHRSRPLPAIADRGIGLTITVVPRLVQKFDLIAFAEDDVLFVQMQYRLDNNAWIPAVSSGMGATSMGATSMEVPLPIGFKDLTFRDGDDAYAKPTPRGFSVAGPLPPGGRAVVLGFALPIKNMRAEVSWDLPAGTVGSRIRLKADPGVSLVDLPPGTTATRVDKHFVVDKVTIPPNRSIKFAVIAPKPDPKQIAIRKACSKLVPDRDSPLIGKPFVDFTAPQLDGKSFKLSSLKGKLLFVTFNASFNRLRDDQRTLPTIAKQLGAEVVTVLSDTDVGEVAKAFGTLSGYVVLDKPAGDTLGPITTSWGIHAVPETYVVDRGGTIRFHIVNQRDWATVDALACLKTGL